MTSRMVRSSTTEMITIIMTMKLSPKDTVTNQWGTSHLIKVKEGLS